MTNQYIRSLKIPKLLSQSIGHYLTIKQIKDEKNNFTIPEKINQLRNLVNCMKNKIRIIQAVERKRKIATHKDDNLSVKRTFNVILRKLNNAKYEIIE